MVDRKRTDSLYGYVVEVTNELVLVGLYYINMGYGVALREGSTIHKLGLTHIVLIFACTTTNALFIIYRSVQETKKWCKLRFCQRQCVLNLKSKCKKCIRSNQSTVKTEAKDQPE